MTNPNSNPNSNPNQNPNPGSDAASAMNEIGDMLQGIGRTIEEGIRNLGARGNVLNVRVDDASLEAIDALISAGVFKTRSEAAAFLIQAGIDSKGAVFSEVNETARRINELKDQMKDTLRKGVGKTPSASGESQADGANEPSKASDQDPVQRPASEPYDV